MIRFIPKSLSSQIALVMVAALLVASAVNFVFIVGERSRAGLIETSGPAIARFVDVVEEVSHQPDLSTSFRPQGAGFGRLMRGGRFNVSANSPIDARNWPRDKWMEDRLTKALKDAGVEVVAVRATIRTFDAATDRGFRQGGPGGPGGTGFGGPGGPGGPFPPGDPRGFGPGGPGSRFRPPPQGDFTGPPTSSTPGIAGSPTPVTSGSPLPGASGSPLPDGTDPRFPTRNRVILRPQGLGGPGGPGPEPVPVPGRAVLLSAQLPGSNIWVTADFFAPEPPRGEIWRLAGSTFVLFAFVLAAALLVASRLSRPLNDLKNAATRVGAASAPEEVAVRGPADVRQTLEAFNAMSRRVSQLLGEKDVMLGALGHDLRTPLASLRIRLETMEPEAERLKAVRTIEETARLLDDILELARQGRSTEPMTTMDLSHLVADMGEDYAETGAAVSLLSTEKAPAACRPILFRRLLRNLIDNALKYGGVAQLVVRKVDGEIEIRVEDEGPGMSAEALRAAKEPFVRGDASRSRSTGGAGLGLALADFIARNHGGRLMLENRSPKGFAAIVRLPAVG